MEALLMARLQKVPSVCDFVKTEAGRGWRGEQNTPLTLHGNGKEIRNEKIVCEVFGQKVGKEEFSKEELGWWPGVLAGL